MHRPLSDRTAMSISILRAVLLIGFVALIAAGSALRQPIYGYAAPFALEAAVLVDVFATRHAVRQLRTMNYRYSTLTYKNTIANFLITYYVLAFIGLSLAVGGWAPVWVAAPMMIVLVLVVLTQGRIIGVFFEVAGTDWIQRRAVALAWLANVLIGVLAVGWMAFRSPMAALVLLPATVALGAAAIKANIELEELSQHR